MNDFSAVAREHLSGEAIARAPAWTRVAEAIFVAFFLSAAAYFALTTLFAIVNFGWRQPMFDQYRSYHYLLEQPFPRNVLQLDNGHRPIVPNLFRVAEIEWFGADQMLQLTVGTLCACASAALLALCAWRERTLPRIARAAGVMLGVLGVLWLANARMLLHGNETLHAYSIVLMLILAATCVRRAARDRSVCWLALSCVPCTIATFSFGPGVATFASVLALGLVLRLPMRWLLWPATVMIACVLVYVFVLPGNQGVRGMLGVYPLESAQIALKWLSSPWINGWLGMGDPPLESSLQAGVRGTGLGPTLIASANAVQSLTHLDWNALAIVLGLLGCVAFCLRVALAWWRRENLSRLQIVAIALCLFAMASAAIVAVSRVQAFREVPNQVFADRYLMWPSLFWAGIALLFVADVARAGTALRALCVAFLIALPLVLSPAQEALAGWGAAVYRIAQRSAAAARSDVFDPSVFSDGPDALRRDVEASLTDLRQRHLAMFAQPGWERLGTRLRVVATPATIGATAHVLDTFHDGASLTVARIEGRVTQGLGELRGHALAVIDDRDTVVGFAEQSFVTDGAGALRLGRAVKRGFDGYIRDYDTQRAYRLVIVSGSDDTARQLCAVEASAAQ